MFQGSELTSTLPEHEKDELKATFKKLDTDSDGYVHLSDWLSGCVYNWEFWTKTTLPERPKQDLKNRWVGLSICFSVCMTEYWNSMHQM